MRRSSVLRVDLPVLVIPCWPMRRLPETLSHSLRGQQEPRQLLRYLTPFGTRSLRLAMPSEVDGAEQFVAFAPLQLTLILKASDDDTRVDLRDLGECFDFTERLGMLS